MADFNFLLPSRPSREGGHAYVSSLAAALAGSGHGVWFGDGPPGGIRIIDGMALPTVAAGQLAGAIGLIHHPTALAPAGQHDATRAAERERLPMLRRVIATSEPAGTRLVEDFGVAAAALSIIRPGVADAPRSTGGDGQHCNILSIGALVPRKGHATLLHALARLFDLPWRLVIVGDTTRDPDHIDTLRAQLAEAGCADRVHFAGPLDASALEAEWRRADMFALATEWEGYSAPVAEALRRGLPVAVADGGNAAELVTPESGIVCSPGDAIGLSKAMRRLIFDTALRTEMADAAWRLGQTLATWPTQAARFVEATTCS